MNHRTVGISAIVLVAVIMGMSAVAPAMAQGQPDPTPPDDAPKDTSGCTETKNQFDEENIPPPVWNPIVVSRTCPS